MGSKQGFELIQAMVKRIKEVNVFDRTLDKLKLISAGNGKCTVEFTVEPEHTNMQGTLHGGFSATLVDCISTFAIRTHGKQVPGVSVDMHITYMKAAKIGDVVVVEADTIRAGRTLAFLDIKIINKKTGKLLVIGTHTKFIG